MQALTLFHSDAFPIARYSEALEAASIAPQSLRSLDALTSDGGALRVVLVDPSILAGRPRELDPRTAVVGVGLAEQPSWLSDENVYFDLPASPAAPLLLKALKNAYQLLYQKNRADALERQLAARTRELREVSEVGIALSTERDHSVLLTKILSKARELSCSDAGSLYLLDELGGGQVLRWKLAQNDSVDVDFEERVLPITKKSLAGYVAMTGETLVIDDAYNPPEGAEYSINTSFDRENGYLTRSMLVFPMTNHAGEVIGVLQLINRKRSGARVKLTAGSVPHEVVAFDRETVELMRSLAGQAAVAVENNLLYESIERLFEGFVTAAVTAIEQRDPTTSGHSFRVADLTVELAKVIDHLDEGEYRHVRFNSDQVREIRYASLLHDFGKVGVREQVLVKAKKLYPMQLETIRGRFDFCMKAVEAEGHRRKLDYLLQYGRDGFEAFAARVDAEMQEEMARLQKDFAFVAQSNEPTVLPEGEFQYLQKIPWTKDLVSVPNIAYAHHEKLNGRGYPRKLTAAEIPIQSRMMTVSDIYDALTASDRPYKRAVPTERALDILKMEMSDGLLDGSLVTLFIEARVFERAGVLRT